MTDSSNGFIPQIENMDLSKLKDKTFAVSISTGNRDDRLCLITYLRGPFDFVEMVQFVSDLWSELQHAKVYVLKKDIKSKLEWLDAKTIDYIIERHADIIMEEVLFSSDKPYTCEAGLIESEET